MSDTMGEVEDLDDAARRRRVSTPAPLESTSTAVDRMQPDDDGQRFWYSRLPNGSLGLALIALTVGAGWAQESAPKAVAWALTAAAAAGWIGTLIWLELPSIRLQRDPLLRRMGLTPWPVSRARTPESHHEEEFRGPGGR